MIACSKCPRRDEEIKSCPECHPEDAPKPNSAPGGNKVRILQTITRMHLPLDRIFDKCEERKLDTAVVVGWTKEGDFYFASSTPDGSDCLWLFELAKKRLLEVGGNR